MNNSNLSEQIKEYRLQNNLTQGQLAEEMGVSATSVGKFERYGFGMSQIYVEAFLRDKGYLADHRPGFPLGHVDFKQCTAEDYRSSIVELHKEIDDLQQKKMELMKERRTLETVMYMLFPSEAMRDGYLSASAAISQRLKRAKEAREKGRMPKSGHASLGALEAENIVKGAKAPPSHIVS